MVNETITTTTGNIGSGLVEGTKNLFNGESMITFNSLIDKLSNGIAAVLAMTTKLFGDNLLIIIAISLLIGFVIGKAATWTQTLKLKLLLGFLIFLVIKFAMDIAGGN